MTLASDLAEIVVKKGTNTYTISMTDSKVTVEMVGAADTQSIIMDGTDITVNCGAMPTTSLLLGGTGMEQQLETKSWIDMMFATHVHPTAAPGPPSPPVPLPAVAVPDTAISPFTYQTKAE